jgi:hypothetical protein
LTKLQNLSVLNCQSGTSHCIPISGSHPETSNDRDEAREEDREATTANLVEDRVGPATNQRRAEVWRAVQQALEVWLAFEVEGFVVEFLRRLSVSLIVT